MAGKQAKILSDQQTRSLHVFASASRNPRRNHLIVLLSLKAGLRAGEIAKLTWDMVVGPTGEIGVVIELRDCAAKKKSGRSAARRSPVDPDHPAVHRR
jgi:integrase